MQVNVVQQQDCHGGKTIHIIGQDDSLYVDKPDEHDRSFDVARVEYNNLDSVTSVIFIRL